jgi:CubicO group peptidase (beta-lactamase class C family)
MGSASMYDTAASSHLLHEHCHVNQLVTTIAVLSALVGGTASAQNDATSVLDPKTTEQIESIVMDGIAAGQMPGAVVVVADSKRVLYQHAFGDRQIEPTREPMTLDTLFDMASLTKPIATATSVMRLVEQGKIDVDQPVSHYLPEFAGHGKQEITVSDLLLHVGGLIPDNALRDYNDGPELAWMRICDLKPIALRGDKFAYTDVGFIVLGKLVERIGGKSLDQFAVDEIFSPLGMVHTRFNPDDDSKRRAAPTEQREERWIKGEVHDPRAYRLDGVAGHAGLFSTAGDLVRYGQMMLSGGRTSSVTILRPDVFALMTKPRTIPRGTRAFGWDHQSPYSSNRGDTLSDAAFGHGGFTGTVMWIDPKQDRIFIFLSNRLHPDGKGSVNKLAGKIASLIGSEP